MFLSFPPENACKNYLLKNIASRKKKKKKREKQPFEQHVNFFPSLKLNCNDFYNIHNFDLLSLKVTTMAVTFSFLLN